MPAPAVHYFSEDSDYSIKNKQKISNWISFAVSAENKKLKELNFIFCSDRYLFHINKSYLHHSTFTDIITFDNSEKEDEIEGDIFISIERIKENTLKYQESFEKELFRVIIHGVLHLIGYKDKFKEDSRVMREKEDLYLGLFPF